MRNVLISIAGIILLTITLVACSAGGGLQTPSTGSGVELQTSEPGTDLGVLDQTFLDGGQGKVTHRAVPSENGYAVEVSVGDAQNLKALFFELEYDATLWHPVECVSTNLLSSEAQPVVLNQLSEPGLVGHGQVLRNYDLLDGFTGDGVLARVVFAPGAPGKEHAQLYDPYPPGSTDVSVPNKTRMFVNHGTDTLRWNYEYRGDYDQNGEVNLADIAPLALHFGKRAPQHPNDIWSYEGVLRLIDGDSNGEINLADLQQISMHYGNRIAQYKTYATQDYSADYPQPGNHQHTLNPLERVPFTDHKGDPATERIWWERTIDGLDYFALYWTQPVVNGALGQPSGIAFEEEMEFPRFEPLFNLEYADGGLSWHYNLRGDGNKNAQTGADDLTPVALNYDLTSHGPFDLSDPQYLIDYDRDGYIRLNGEAMVMSIHHGSRIKGMAVYSSTSADDAGANPQSASTIEPIALLNWEDSISTPDDIRTWFSHTVDASPGTYFWIRPVRSFHIVGYPDEFGPRSEVIWFR